MSRSATRDVYDGNVMSTVGGLPSRHCCDEALPFDPGEGGQQNAVVVVGPVLSQPIGYPPGR